jgi:hypothetical protein
MKAKNNSAIALYVEKIASELFDIDGYKSLAKKDRNLLKYTNGGDQGFDDIAFNPDLDLNGDVSNYTGDIVIIEAKSKPPIEMNISNNAAGNGKIYQMSDEWIEKTANSLIATGDPKKVKLGTLIEKRSKARSIQKAVVTVEETTGEIIVQKLK